MNLIGQFKNHHHHYAPILIKKKYKKTKSRTNKRLLTSESNTNETIRRIGLLYQLRHLRVSDDRREICNPNSSFDITIRISNSYKTQKHREFLEPHQRQWLLIGNEITWRHQAITI